MSPLVPDASKRVSRTPNVVLDVEKVLVPPPAAAVELSVNQLLVGLEMLPW